MSGKLAIFARFHVREGMEADVASLLREQIAIVRSEPGCFSINAYCSKRDPRLFFIHSRWADEAAFEVHAILPNTDNFIAKMKVSWINH